MNGIVGGYLLGLKVHGLQLTVGFLWFRCDLSYIDGIKNKL